MSSSGGLRVSLHYVGGIIFLKCSRSLSLSLAVSLSLCLFPSPSLLLLFNPLQSRCARERRREKTDICLTKSSEEATLFDPLPNSQRPLSFGHPSLVLSLSHSLHLCDLCVSVGVYFGQEWAEREDGLQTMACILLCPPLLPSALSLLSVSSSTCHFCCVLLRSDWHRQALL